MKKKTKEKKPPVEEAEKKKKKKKKVPKFPACALVRVPKTFLFAGRNKRGALFQDQVYGVGVRVCNKCKAKSDGEPPKYRDTVTGDVFVASKSDVITPLLC